MEASIAIDFSKRIKDLEDRQMLEEKEMPSTKGNHRGSSMLEAASSVLQ